MNAMIVRANSERGAPELPSTVTHVRWGNVQGSKMHGGPSTTHKANYMHKQALSWGISPRGAVQAASDP